MAITGEQRRHIRLALARLVEEADDTGAGTLARQAAEVVAAIAPGSDEGERAAILRELRDATEADGARDHGGGR